jgi:hypothetical protein
MLIRQGRNRLEDAELAERSAARRDLRSLEEGHGRLRLRGPEMKEELRAVLEWSGRGLEMEKLHVEKR